MTPAEQFLSAMDECADAYDQETAPVERRRLASAAFVFAQVAEYLERGPPLTQAIITHCTDAISLIRDDYKRRKIEVLLSRDRSVDVRQKAEKSVPIAAER